MRPAGRRPIFKLILIAGVFAAIAGAYFYRQNRLYAGNSHSAEEADSTMVTFQDKQNGFRVRYPGEMGTMRLDDGYSTSLDYNLDNVLAVRYFRNPSYRPFMAVPKGECPVLSDANRETSPLGGSDVCFQVPLQLGSPLKGYILEGHAEGGASGVPHDFVTGSIVQPSGDSLSVILQVSYTMPEGNGRLKERKAAEALLSGVQALPVPSSDTVQY